MNAINIYLNIAEQNFKEIAVSYYILNWVVILKLANSCDYFTICLL